MKTKPILFLLFAIVASLHARAPDQPPTIDKTYEGIAFDVLFNGTTPMTYQWYRGTQKNPKKEKIPAPEGIQRTYRPNPPYVSGWYVCVATNAAGEVTSDPFQLSLTKSKTAASMKVTIKQP